MVTESVLILTVLSLALVIKTLLEEGASIQISACPILVLDKVSDMCVYGVKFINILVIMKCLVVTTACQQKMKFPELNFSLPQ